MCKWIFIWLGTKMMLLSSQIGAFSAQEFNKYLFGDVFGNVVNTLLLLVLFGVTSVMLSGPVQYLKSNFAYQDNSVFSLQLSLVSL